MKLGATLTSTVEVTRFEPDALIEMRSVTGFVNNSLWRFSAEEAERTRISVDFHYDLPGGLAGRALGKVIEPFVTVAVRQTEQTLRHRIEAHHHASE